MFPLHLYLGILSLIAIVFFTLAQFLTKWKSTVVIVLDVIWIIAASLAMYSLVTGV